MSTKTLVDRLNNGLRTGIVRFAYTKKDGTLRAALGTTVKDEIQENHWPKGNDNTYPDNVIRYYDLEAEGWRSLIADNLTEVKYVINRPDVLNYDEHQFDSMSTENLHMLAKDLNCSHPTKWECDWDRATLIEMILEQTEVMGVGVDYK